MPNWRLALPGFVGLEEDLAGARGVDEEVRGAAAAEGEVDEVDGAAAEVLEGGRRVVGIHGVGEDAGMADEGVARGQMGAEIADETEAGEAVGLQGVMEGVEIEEAQVAGDEEQSAGFKQAEAAGVEVRAQGGGEGDLDRDDFAEAEEFVELGGAAVQAIEVDLFGEGVAGPEAHFGLEGAGGDGAAGLAEADEAEPAVGEAGPIEASGPLLKFIPGRVGPGAGGVVGDAGDVDAAASGGVEGSGVDAGAGGGTEADDHEAAGGLLDHGGGEPAAPEEEAIAAGEDGVEIVDGVGGFDERIEGAGAEILGGGGSAGGRVEDQDAGVGQEVGAFGLHGLKRRSGWLCRVVSRVWIGDGSVKLIVRAPRLR